MEQKNLFLVMILNLNLVMFCIHFYRLLMKLVLMLKLRLIGF